MSKVFFGKPIVFSAPYLLDFNCMACFTAAVSSRRALTRFWPDREDPVGGRFLIVIHNGCCLSIERNKWIVKKIEHAPGIWILISCMFLHCYIVSTRSFALPGQLLSSQDFQGMGECGNLTIQLVFVYYESSWVVWFSMHEQCVESWISLWMWNTRNAFLAVIPLWSGMYRSLLTQIKAKGTLWL